MEMRRRSVLTAGAVGAAAVLTGGAKAMAATQAPPATLTATVTATVTASSGDAPWAAASLRDLAAVIGLRIGSALTPADLTTAAYSAIASGQFDVYTPENEMKWQVVEPEQGTFDWTGADNLVNYAKANNALVRGHTLCWHNQLPDWLTANVANGDYTQAQLLDLLQAHIFTEVGRYRGEIWQWDVANEFLTDSSPSQVDPNNWWIVNAGPEVITKAFQWAHEADPKALLLYNDYNIGGGRHEREVQRRGRPRAVSAAECPHRRHRHPGAPGHPVRMEPDAAASGHRGLRRHGPQGGADRGRRSDVRQQRRRPGADGQPVAVRAALRVPGDAQGRPRGPRVHLVHRLGLRRLRVLGPGHVHR